MKSVTFNEDNNQIRYYDKDEVKYDEYLSVVCKYLYGEENIKEETLEETLEETNNVLDIDYLILKSGKKVKRG